MTKDAASHGDVLAMALAFLGRHPPFERMSKADRHQLASRLTLKRYAAGETILTPEDGPARALYIVKQGRVTAALCTGAAEEGVWDLDRGSCFPIGALIAGRPVSAVLRAAEETLCFRLKREAFESLRGRSPELQDFCTRRLASLLDLALHDLRSRLAQRGGASTLGASLRGLISREPVVCAAQTRLRDALARMYAERVDSIVAVDAQRRPAGIFTLHDLLARGTAGELALDRPLAEAMTPRPACLDADASGFAAALLMADHGLGHVCVTEGGGLIGVLSERDLFGLRRLGLGHLHRDIAEAEDIDALGRLAASVPSLIDQMLSQGASVEQITGIITAFNDKITRRVVDLILAEAGRPAVTFSWIAFGSEGRREQTLKTDQDNGILFQVPPGSSADQVRTQLLPIATRVNDALTRCGLPYCGGKVMASNPDWCLSQEEWSRKFAEWVNKADGRQLLYASVFFDFRTIVGPEEPVEDLRSWLLAMVPEHRNFLRRMADNALDTRPPLGLLRDFVTKKGGDAPNTLDLKLNGITPFVDSGRIFALSAGAVETNTPERLRAAWSRWGHDPAEVEVWVDAFHFIQLLRLRRQREQLRRHEEPDNRIDPDQLNEIERRALKDAFRQARKLQSRLGQFFQF